MEFNQILKKWDEKNVPTLNGKVFLITGANSGLGFRASEVLSTKNGATIVMACRSEASAKKAIEQIKTNKNLAQNVAIHFLKLDLNDLDDVLEVKTRLKKLGISKLDVLLNNAGVMALPKRVLTKNGFEKQFGVNHLGHFVLTAQLVDMLAKDARIVNVSSIAHELGKMNWDDLNFEKGYGPWVAYRQSKLANLLFSLELKKRLLATKSGVQVMSAHPGLARTNLAKNMRLFSFLKIGSLFKAIAYLATPLGVSQSVRMGTLPILYACVAKEAQNGAYYGPKKRLSGYPSLAEVKPHAQDEKSAARLWELSEKLTGVKFSL